MDKKTRVQVFCQSVVLSALLGMSCVGCMVTGFTMSEVNTWILGLFVVATALICSLCYTRKLGLIPFLLLVAVGIYLWQSGLFLQSAESFLYEITRTYNGAYGWKILRWSYRTADQLALTLGPLIYFYGCLVAMLTAWAIGRGNSSVFALMPATVPVLLCFVVTDTLPNLAWLILFFATMLIMMLTSSIRQEDAKEGCRLTFYVALPAIVAVTLLFYVIPEAGYHRQSEAQILADTLFADSPVQYFWEKITGQNTAVGSSVDGLTVDLSRVGYRQDSQTEVMRVNSRTSGVLYLRGRALDGYDGTQWYDTQQSTGLHWPDEPNLITAGEVVISTRYAHRMLYLPYYATSVELDTVNRGLENEKKLTMYSFSYSVPAADLMRQLYPNSSFSPVFYSDYVGSNLICTDLPEETLGWAVPLVNQITEGLVSPYHKAQAIARYVRQSAEYDLQTRRMSSRSKDFAQWFLEESSTGYCVHFATATTVLLKAAGIPARYITGYMVEVEAGETAVVRADDAHAWVEYWLPGFGWTTLEATPSANAEQNEALPGETQPGQESTTPQQTQPADQGGEQSTAPEQAPSLIYTPKENPAMTAALTVLLWTGILLLVIGLAVAQWRLRVILRRRKRHKGNTNQQAVAHWQEVVLLSKYQNGLPDNGLYELAEKARFSQHTITEEELAAFDLRLDGARQQLRIRNVLKQLWYTLILALY